MPSQLTLSAYVRLLMQRFYLRDGDAVEIHAQSGPLRGGQIGTRRALNNDRVAGRAVVEARTIHVPDLFTSDEYPRSREIALRYGHRATLAVPLIHNGTAVGGILVRRQQARPFTDKQIALVQTSPLKPSSPSRTRGCLTNCASAPPTSPNLWSSRRPRRRCCALSVRHRVIFSQYFLRC